MAGQGKAVAVGFWWFVRTVVLCWFYGFYFITTAWLVFYLLLYPLLDIKFPPFFDSLGRWEFLDRSCSGEKLARGTKPGVALFLNGPCGIGKGGVLRVGMKKAPGGRAITDTSWVGEFRLHQDVYFGSSWEDKWRSSRGVKHFSATLMTSIQGQVLMELAASLPNTGWANCSRYSKQVGLVARRGLSVHFTGVFCYFPVSIFACIRTRPTKVSNSFQPMLMKAKCREMVPTPQRYAESVARPRAWVQKMFCYALYDFVCS